jgi:ADP-heptose:LPS heptosyltransferase
MQLKNILVIKLSAFGDFVLMLGYMKHLRDENPHAHITLMTTKMLAGFAEYSGYFDDIWIVERWKFFDFKKWISFRKMMKEKKIEAVYDLQCNKRTSLMHFYTPNKNKIFWPYSNKNKKESHAKHIFKNEAVPSIKDMKWLDADISKYNIREPYVILVPGCAPQHPHKRWPAEFYKQLAEKIIQQGFKVVVVGTNDEKNVIEEICNSQPQAINLCNKTSMLEIAGLGRHAIAAIGNDTGPMHLISAVGCSVVSLFANSSNPHQAAPKGPVVKVLHAELISTIDVDSVMKEFNIITKKEN